MSKAAELAALIGSQSSLSNRNMIINGAAVIDQRNGGSSVTPTSSAYTLDRWLANVTAASKYSVQQSTVAPDNFTNSFLITSTSAYTPVSGDYMSFQTRIEANNIAHVGWGSSAAKTVTLSFWVRSSLTGTFGGSFYFPASTVRTHPFSYTINSANTWEYKTVNIVGDTVTNTAPTGNNLYVIVQWALGAGSTYQTGTSGWQNGNYVAPSGVVDLVATSGATLYITGVQLEVGEQATPFEHRSFGDELARCQRYYEKSYNQADSPATTTSTNSLGRQIDDGSIQRDGIDFQIIKRANPTVTIYNPTTGSTGSIRTNANVDYSATVFAIGENRAIVYYTPASGEFLFFHFTADAEL